MHALALGKLFPFLEVNTLPTAVLVAGNPHAMPVQMNHPSRRIAQSQDALGTMDVKAEPQAIALVLGIAGHRFEMSGDAVFKNKIT